MLRIGRIPYLNCEPFFARLGGVELVALNPRRLGEAVAAGELDAGPLSLVDQLRLETTSSPCPSASPTDHAAQSVFLFSHRPLRELAGPSSASRRRRRRRSSSCACCSPSSTR